MSLPKPDLHVRLSPRAMEELRCLALAEDTDISKLAARYLEEALLGKGHTLRIAAKRVMMAGIERE